LTVPSLHFARNGKENAAALHDVGLAAATLTFEATARGLAVHQMIGILPDRAREVYAIDDGHRPFTALAIGYAAAAGDAIDPELAARDGAPRTRKALREVVFAGSFGRPAAFIAQD